MRILVLIHEFPPVGGGGGRVAQDLCEGFISHGHQVELLTAHLEPLPYKEQISGIQIHRLKSGRKEPYRAGLFAMLGFVWASFWQGLKSIRRERPDIIHAHFAVPAGAVAWALSVITGVPYILTAHLGDVPGGVPEKTGKWFRWIFPFTPPIWKRASHVAAVSEFTRNLALKHYPVAIEVIPNGVNLEQINPGQIHVHLPPRIVFAGRFMPQKNPLQIVSTLGRIKDLDWRCTLIGDGPLRAEIEQAIQNEGLTDRITLTGWLTPQEVLTWYADSDLYFMPSLSEGLPVVGVQALAMGLALVLSSVGGSVELIQQGVNGYLAAPDDSASFEQALRKLLSDPQALLSARQASREMAARLDIQKVVQSYEQLFNKAVSVK